LFKQNAIDQHIYFCPGKTPGVKEDSMLKDLHTALGQKAMKDGKAAERRFFQSFNTMPIEWIAEDSDKLLAGHDFVLNGRTRVELKSNAGVDATGAAYDTVCVETITRGGNLVGWKQKKADLVVFVNRATWEAYIYDAFQLKAYSYSRPTFARHEALCFTMPWIEPGAGFKQMVQL